MTNNITPEQLTLYYSPICPFCHRVLDALSNMGLTPNLKSGLAGDITLKNTHANSKFRDELVAGGGKKTVPCLRIEQNGKISWMYESLDIISFLDKNLS